MGRRRRCWRSSNGRRRSWTCCRWRLWKLVRSQRRPRGRRRRRRPRLNFFPRKNCKIFFVTFFVSFFLSLSRRSHFKKHFERRKKTKPRSKTKMTVGPPPASASSQQLHGFSKQQVEKAARALLAHLGKQRGRSGGGGNDLFDDDDELLYMVREKINKERVTSLATRWTIPFSLMCFVSKSLCLLFSCANGRKVKEKSRPHGIHLTSTSTSMSTSRRRRRRRRRPCLFFNRCSFFFFRASLPLPLTTF